MLKKILIAFAVLVGIPLAAGAVYQGYQGGTGIGSATSGQIGYVPTVIGVNPFLIYGLATPSSTATTTINGSQCPVFTFSVVGTTSPSSYTTSSCSIFLNLLSYSSSSQITISSTGTLLFSSNLISQFTNDSGYIATNTGNWSGTWQGYNHTDFLASSTSYLSSYNVTCVSGCTDSTTTNSAAITVTASGLASYNVTTANGLISVSTTTTSAALTASTSPQFGTVTATKVQDSLGNAYVTSTSGGTPAGSNGNIQFNSNGSFGATTTFTFSTTTAKLTVPGLIISNATGSILETDSSGNVVGISTGTLPYFISSQSFTTSTAISDTAFARLATSTFTLANSGRVMVLLSGWGHNGTASDGCGYTTYINGNNAATPYGGYTVLTKSYEMGSAGGQDFPIDFSYISTSTLPAGSNNVAIYLQDALGGICTTYISNFQVEYIGQ